MYGRLSDFASKKINNDNLLQIIRIFLLIRTKFIRTLKGPVHTYNNHNDEQFQIKTEKAYQAREEREQVCTAFLVCNFLSNFF